MPRATVTANNATGFSLLEVIGVMAIIVILSSLLLPTVIHRLDAGTQEAEVENLASIAQAIALSLRENRAWPADLASLSPDYLALNTNQITQNKAGFPRYYIIHPNTSGFTNAAGLATTDLDDARFLLISNLKADAAPTITNAAQFDTWWNTDETSTPNLKIHRGNVGHLFRLLDLRADFAGGSHQIDGVTTNPACATLPTHTRYHLPGTVVGLDEAGTYSGPEVQFSQAADTGYRFDCGLPVGSQWRAQPGPNATCWGLWLSTVSDVNGGATPCLTSWTDGMILQFGHPNLVFESGPTDGSFSVAVNLDNFSFGGVNGFAAVHYVASNLTVGSSNSIDLFRGDVLISTSNLESFYAFPPFFVSEKDVFVFRPDTPGDYSSGTFILLLNNLNGNRITGISLVEQDVLVGDVTLQAGSFLFASDSNDVQYFVPTSVGAFSTSGTISLLIEGDDIGMSEEVWGLDVVEEVLVVGGTTLQAGFILLTPKDNDLGGRNEDIFYLDVTATTMGSGTATASATLWLDGSDVKLNGPQRDIDGLTLVPTL